MRSPSGHERLALGVGILASLALAIAVSADDEGVRRNAASRPTVPFPSRAIQPRGSPDPAMCGRSLQEMVDQASAGATLDLTGCVYSAGATIDKPLTVRGATLELPKRTDDERWTPEIVIRASDVRLVDLTTRNGANVVAIEGPFNRTVVRNADMRDQIGSGIWIKGAASDTIIEGVTLITDPTYRPTSEPGVSPIRVEGCLDPWPCSPLAYRTTIRDSFVDQGPFTGDGGPGWFGIELIRAPDSVIERTVVRGGHTMISIPNSDGTVIRENTLDTSSGATWGIEVAGSSDVWITGNMIDGVTRGEYPQAGISWNSTGGRVPLGTIVTGNSIRNMDVAFQLSGDLHVISRNCLQRLNREVYAYGGIIGPNVKVTDNAACD